MALRQQFIQADAASRRGLIQALDFLDRSLHLSVSKSVTNHFSGNLSVLGRTSH